VVPGRRTLWIISTSGYTIKGLFSEKKNNKKNKRNKNKNKK
jgi:hypothetical protein